MSANTVLLPKIRRRSVVASYVNAALWGAGNGLVSMTLVFYLANELGAGRLGLGVGFIVAAPGLVGVLRMFAPALIGRLAARKTFCIACFAASAVLLMSLPFLAAPGNLPSPDMSLAALAVLWSVYHLLEYLGTIALT